jgi:putative nucleotidyltransferase with HDIG domain
MTKSPSIIQSRVARRIFVLFVICALLPVSLLALLSLHRVSTWLQDESRQRLRQVGKNAGMTVMEGLTFLQDELESMTATPRDESGKIPLPASGRDRDNRFRAVTVMKMDAGSGMITGIPRRLSPSELSHLAAGHPLIIAPADLAVGAPIYMVTSVNRNLPQGSLLVGEIDTGYLWTLVGYTLPSAVDICILGPTGKTLFATGTIPPALVPHVVTRLKGASTGQFQWNGKDEEFLVNYWSLFLKPAFHSDTWTVLAVQSRRDSLGPARSFRNTFLLVVLLSIFVVIFVSSFLIRRNLVPLAILRDGAGRLSKGDFDSRVEIASGDEFEDLAVSFNDMSEKLGKQFARVSEMASFVQGILEAHDREKIIEMIMSSFRHSVHCEWLGLALMDSGNPLQARAFYNKASPGEPSRTEQFDSLLSGGEFETIRATAVSLYARGIDRFSTLLAPMADEGGDEFFLFPISIKDRFLGLLILGYRTAPEQVREELVRASQIADEIAIALDNVRLIDELNSLNWGTIETLAKAVDAKSPWTAGHSERVTMLALEIGKEMEISERELDMLHWGGLFHDMGKIGVPEDILDKPGKLTDEEFAIIKKHPRKGAEILAPIRTYHEAIPIVAQHHERFDGQGYPLGLSGEEISLGARILAVADVFDALYSDRPYRQGWEIGKLMAYMEENAGRHFDPKVVRAFMGIELDSYFKSHADTDLTFIG